MDEDDKELYRELFSKIETNHDVLNIRKNAHQEKEAGRQNRGSQCDKHVRLHAQKKPERSRLWAMLKAALQAQPELTSGWRIGEGCS